MSKMKSKFIGLCCRLILERKYINKYKNAPAWMVAIKIKLRLNAIVVKEIQYNVDK